VFPYARPLHLGTYKTLNRFLLNIELPRRTIEVDSDMIDRSTDELSKLILRLEKNPKITRKDRNTIKKIEEIRDTIQDSVLYAKLKKSV
jgi:hypothetical protein